jgi:phage tail-like protein
MGSTDSRNDPVASFNFEVQIDGIGLRAGFSEISGLSTETDIIEYREGSDAENHNRKLCGRDKVTNLALKRGYTPNGKELWAWRQAVINGMAERHGGTIILKDEAKNVALKWQFSEGWPSKWAGPAFNAKNNDVAIEEMEICIEKLVLDEG